MTLNFEPFGGWASLDGQPVVVSDVSMTYDHGTNLLFGGLGMQQGSVTTTMTIRVTVPGTFAFPTPEQASQPNRRIDLRL